MYLGIDIGTSELKALIVNPQGEIVASNHATLSVQRPHPHWAEQDPSAGGRPVVRRLPGCASTIRR
ncbi:hypothetical protein E05_23040 [Plautia stali symbiont]|nr:hypothetical protein E05_23040 [Plautia stali symbiont]